MTRSRRAFVRDGVVLAAGAAVFRSASPLLDAAGAKWPIGCFNRPWTKWSFAETLTAIKSAGYTSMGLLTPTEQDPFIADSATPQYLESLKKTLAASGLRAVMGSLRSRHDVPIAETIASLHKQIDNAAFLGLESVITFGTDRDDQLEQYLSSMADAAAYGQEKKVKVVMKPHGGSSGAAEQIVASMKKVNHPNFRIWYDAGNIIYYTGKDPVAELEPIVQYVTGFCAKDCAAPNSEVMIQFGTGKVDFKGVFNVLKRAGFDGPIVVECCAVADTPQATAANARANREFLERVLAEI
jgi:sugar phosphate isomerase/epimerase